MKSFSDETFPQQLQKVCRDLNDFAWNGIVHLHVITMWASSPWLESDVSLFHFLQDILYDVS